MSSFPDEQGPGPPRRVPLGRLLIARGLLTEEQLIEGLLEQDRTGDRLGQVLIRLGFVDEPSVAMALATQHGGPLKTEYGFATGFDPGGGTEPATSQPHAEPSATVTALPPIESQRDAAFGDARTFPSDHDRTPTQVDPMVDEDNPAQAQLDAARMRITDLEQELIDAQEQLVEERSKTAELDDARTRIVDLEQELAATREQLDERRSQTAELEEEVASIRLAAETAISALRGVAEVPSLVGAD